MFKIPMFPIKFAIFASILGVAKWKKIAEDLNNGEQATVGPYNRIYAIYCEVTDNGEGVIICGEKKGDLQYITTSNVNGNLVITATTTLSGKWYVKDITNR